MRLKLLALCSVMAGPAFAQDINLTTGDYIWTNSWGCSTLSLQSQWGYSFDAGCDGSIDYAASRVYLDGNRIWMDEAYLELEGANAQEVRGQFHFNGVNPAVFVRQ